MPSYLIIKSILTWILIIPVAIFNGAIRNMVYKKYTGELLGHQVSCFTGSAAIIVLGYFMLKNEVINSNYGQLFFIGILWVILTILFEFGFGHYVTKNSWEKLLADYNIFKGRLWILVLVTTLFTPVLIKYILGH